MPEEFGPNKEIITSIYQLSPEALEQIAQWQEQRGLRIPVSQVVGFQQFYAQIATVATAETRNNAAYGDLTTAGPTLSGLSAGKYIFWYGCSSKSGDDGAANTFSAYMAPSINGAAPDDNTAAISGGFYPPPQMSNSGAMTADLTLDNNTVKLQYKISAATTNPGLWVRRYLISLRVGNIK